jgi:UDP-2,3-diacylglucosamine pyrophosphatase LpxH
VLALLQARPELCHALRRHLLAGTPVTLLAGNHDAATAAEAVRTGLLEFLELAPAAPLETAPWFIRRGTTHIEHGHFYDPDNAPAHPLAPWSPLTEPLGVALTRRFLAPYNVLDFAHAHETTPAAGIWRAFELYRARTPLVIAQYFKTAIRLCAEPGRKRQLAEERELGSMAISEYASAWGLHESIVEELASAGASPTHQRFKDVFMRLYFDRILAALGLTSAAGLGVFAGSTTGLGLAAVCAAYLAVSASTGSRYSGRPEQRLRDAAARIRETSGAELVIFGHTHREEDERQYINCGSFVFSRRDGRPYIHVDAGVAQRCVLPLSA